MTRTAPDYAGAIAIRWERTGNPVASAPSRCRRGLRRMGIAPGRHHPA